MLAQRSDLGLLGGADLKSRGKQSEQGNEDRAHCENDDDLTNDLTTSVFSTRTSLFPYSFETTSRYVGVCVMCAMPEASAPVSSRSIWLPSFSDAHRSEEHTSELQSLRHLV